MSNECVVSSDCVKNNIVKECFIKVIFSDKEYFCDCSNWYGWIGKRCDEISI